MPIEKLRLQNIGPFNDIEFEFDKQVNVFVGPNNTGKSTALYAIGDICVFPFEFPARLLHTSLSSQFTVTLPKNGRSMTTQGKFPISIGGHDDFWTKERCDKWFRYAEHIEYTTYLPAIRYGTDFRAKGPMSKDKDSDDEVPEGFIRKARGRQYIVRATKKDELPDHFSNLERVSTGDNSTILNVENIIQKMINLDYRSYRENNLVYRNVIEKVATIASEITDGFPVEFVKIAEDKQGLYPEFSTPHGDVPINVLSQGTQSILYTLAQMMLSLADYYQYPKDLERQRAILILDEIDAHLHPSWQKRFIPTLTKHFPNLQIFCSTHSPLVLGGLKTGQIQLLRWNGDRIVASSNSTDITGWSFDEVLQGLLGVSTATDAETDYLLLTLEELQNRQHPSKEDIGRLNDVRNQLRNRLVSGFTNLDLPTSAKILSSQKLDRKKKVARKKVARKKVARKKVARKKVARRS